MAEVAREHGWHPPKSLDSDENFKPEHTLFCRELRFVAIYALFGDLWAKKGPLLVKNDAFVAKIVNTRLTKGFMAIFAPAESLPSPATLLCGTGAETVKRDLSIT